MNWEDSIRLKELIEGKITEVRKDKIFKLNLPYDTYRRCDNMLIRNLVNQYEELYNIKIEYDYGLINFRILSITDNKDKKDWKE